MAWAVVASVAIPVVGQAIMGDNGQGVANAASAQAASQSAQTSAQQAAIAQDQWNTYKQQFSPVNTQLSGLALAAGSPAQIMQEGTIAGANAQQQIGVTNAAKDRALMRSGVNPNSGNALALATENANIGALTTTGAVNTARKNALDSAFAKTLDTVNAGNHVASNATTGLSAATQGAAAASRSSADVASNAALANQAQGAMLNKIGTAVGGWLGGPTTTTTTPPFNPSAVTTSLGTAFYNPNGYLG